MSIDSLNPNKDAPHRLHHDLESLLYVIIWVCTVQAGPRNHRRCFKYSETELFHWNAGKGAQTAIRSVWDSKSCVMMNEENFKDLIVKRIDNYFASLKDCITKLRNILFPASMTLLSNIPTASTQFDATQDNVYLEVTGEHASAGKMSLMLKSPPNLRDQARLATEFICVLDDAISELQRVPDPPLEPLSLRDSDTTPPAEIFLKRVIDLDYEVESASEPVDVDSGAAVRSTSSELTSSSTGKFSTHMKRILCADSYFRRPNKH